MATARSTQQNINTQLVLIGFAVMTVAFAFVAVLTNMVVNSKVNALSRSYQSNPVTVAAAPQTNTVAATSCQVPSATADSEGVTTAAAAGGQTNTLPGVWGAPKGGMYAMLGNYSQSNTSTTNTTSNNTFIKDSYNTRTSSMFMMMNNGNTNDSNNSSSTTTTTNTDNSNSSTNTSTNVQDFSNSSTNTNTNTNVNQQDYSNNSTNTNNTDNSITTDNDVTNVQVGLVNLADNN